MHKITTHLWYDKEAKEAANLYVSIFPDSKSGTYILPLKAKVRKKENIYEGDTVTFSCDIV